MMMTKDILKLPEVGEFELNEEMKEGEITDQGRRQSAWRRQEETRGRR